MTAVGFSSPQSAVIEQRSAMQVRSSLAGLLLFALTAVTSGLRREYYLVEEEMSWEEARQYCREKHTDLAFVSNQQEADQVAGIAFGSDSERKDVWIGLHANRWRRWMWSGGWELSFGKWENEPANAKHGECAVVCVGSGRWHVEDCEAKLAFVCFDLRTVLVREKKTWDEALEYCRERYTDLASLLSPEEDQQAQYLIRQAKSHHVWMGLRYVAGWWLWVNGDPLEHQGWEGRMPQCPAGDARCGTLPRDGSPHWGRKDCEKKNNFLCFL